jgi:cyclic pyranopterin phosphate synthase
MTTNGVRLKNFLPHLRAAGLRGINLSVDTLVAAKFPLLARKPLEWHVRIMEAMREVMEQEEHFKLKLNCVMLRGVNEDEIGAFMDLTEHHPVEVRFLEFMPFSGNGWSANRLVPQAEILAAFERHVENRGEQLERLPPDRLDDVARLWKECGRASENAASQAQTTSREESPRIATLGVLPTLPGEIDPSESRAEDQRVTCTAATSQASNS